MGTTTSLGSAVVRMTFLPVFGWDTWQTSICDLNGCTVQNWISRFG